MRGRETGSPEHRKAADYVAEHFKQAGLQPAGSSGYLQPVAFRSRRSTSRSPAWLSSGRASRSRSPSVTRRPSACGSIQRRAWTRRSCSPGTDSRFPKPSTTTSPPGRQGQGGRVPGGQPEAGARGAERALSVRGGTLEHAEAPRGNRRNLHRQPQGHGRAVGAFVAKPPEPRDGAGRRVARRHRRPTGFDRLQSREGRTPLRRLRSHVRRAPAGCR